MGVHDYRRQMEIFLTDIEKPEKPKQAATSGGIK